MPVLVRIVHHSPSCRGIERHPNANDSSRERGNAHHGVPQMGNDDLVHHPGVTKRHLAGFDVHLPPQAVEPRSQRETGERIQAAHGGIDAGKQV